MVLAKLCKAFLVMEDIFQWLCNMLHATSKSGFELRVGLLLVWLPTTERKMNWCRYLILFINGICMKMNRFEPGLPNPLSEALTVIISARSNLIKFFPFSDPLS